MLLFRRRGNTVQIFRLAGEAGDARNELVGRLPVSAREVPAELKSACGADELVQLEAWLASEAQLESLKEEHAARLLSESLALAAQWFERAAEDKARPVAAEVGVELASLVRLLKKKGYSA